MGTVDYQLGCAIPPGAAPVGHGGVHPRRRAPASARTGGVRSQGLGSGSGRGKVIFGNASSEH
eukprot:9487981-Alexandrium_andersonii.AAC.1